MKKFLAWGALAAATIATPSFAQGWRHHNPGYDNGAHYSSAVERNREVIAAALRTGLVDRREFARINDAQRTLETIVRRYRANGLSLWERRNLDSRIAAIRANVDRAVHEGNRRYHRNYVNRWN